MRTREKALKPRQVVVIIIITRRQYTRTYLRGARRVFEPWRNGREKKLKTVRRELISCFFFFFLSSTISSLSLSFFIFSVLPSHVSYPPPGRVARRERQNARVYSTQTDVWHFRRHCPGAPAPPSRRSLRTTGLKAVTVLPPTPPPFAKNEEQIQDPCPGAAFCARQTVTHVRWRRVKTHNPFVFRLSLLLPTDE